MTDKQQPYNKQTDKSAPLNQEAPTSVADITSLMVLDNLSISSTSASPLSPFSQLSHGILPKTILTTKDLSRSPIHSQIYSQTPDNKTTRSTNNNSLPNNSRHNNKAPSRWQKLIALPAYYWTLIAIAVVIIPHFSYMPVWLVIYALFSVIMQLPQIKARLSQQNHKKKRLKTSYRIIQLSAFVLGVLGLWYRFAGFSVEAGVGFLLLCLASKLWEMYQRRDAFVLLNLSLFVCASLFLLDQGLGSSLVALCSVLTVLMAFIAMNDDNNTDGSGRVRSLALLLGLALPLMVVLFLFFPRLPPLWSLKLSSPQAKTGMSDSMSPGDFANLSKSTELAFRVRFDKDIPSRQTMYWRGLVFSDFNGNTWSIHRPQPIKGVKQHQLFPWSKGQQKPQWLIEATNSSQQTFKNYQVTLEPTNQKWLFALDYPTTAQQNMELTPNFTLRSWQENIVQYRYQASYQTDMRINQHLSAYERQINLALPETGNERSRQLAKQLYQQAGNTQSYINAIARWINQSNFHYTLSPPLLGKERIDEFLFDTQAGFCEHYSSSFTYLMRAAGVPARIVVGYQGGELGRDGSSWEVRQMDAHAWSEVWMAGRGWVRIDPTSFVAPERIEKGMDELTNEQGSAMFGDGMTAQLSYQQFKMLQQLRRLSDQMSYYWQRDIVGYDQNSQSQSLFKWFNIKSVYQQILTMTLTLVVIIGLVIFWLWFKRRQKWHPADRHLIKLSKRLAKHNPQLKKHDNEGMLAWLERIMATEAMQDQTHQLKFIQRHYRRLRYSPVSKLDPKEPAYQQALAQLNNAIDKISIKHTVGRVDKL